MAQEKPGWHQEPITLCSGFGEESPSTPCRAELAPLAHPVQGQKGMQKIQQFPREAPGALQAQD